MINASRIYKYIQCALEARTGAIETGTESWLRPRCLALASRCSGAHPLKALGARNTMGQVGGSRTAQQAEPRIELAARSTRPQLFEEEAGGGTGKADNSPSCIGASEPGPCVTIFRITARRKCETPPATGRPLARSVHGAPLEPEGHLFLVKGRVCIEGERERGLLPSSSSFFVLVLLFHSSVVVCSVGHE